jgi:phosphoribosylformimino-5-aminoimidazole carboxamide ribotide isomerase
MDLWPAIDIRDGRCVRLRQGDFDDETHYGDPVAVAIQYLEAGAERLHVVDLDAARTGDPVNGDVIRSIVSRTGLLVQAGGGVRDQASAAALLDHGVQRVVIGTAAVTENAEHLDALFERWPGRIVVGLDYRSYRDAHDQVVREVAVRGWTEASGVVVEDALAFFAERPVAGLVVTDIRRDGTAIGPDFAEYEELLAATAVPLLASGGVASAADIARLARIDVDGRTLAGVVVGKALLDGTLTMAGARQASLGLTL